MVICLERGADLHMAQQIPLPLTVSCFSKIQIGFTFQVPAHPGSPGQRAIKRVCVYCFRDKRAICRMSPISSILPAFGATIVDDPVPLFGTWCYRAALLA